jgi:ribonuclease E
VEVPIEEVQVEAAPVIEEAAPAAESFPVEEPVAEPVVEIVPEPVVEDASAVVVEEAPEVAKGDDHFINDEF